MSFKKLNPLLLEKMQDLGITEPTPFQQELIPKIKSGANLFAIAPKGAGKTEAMIISIFQRLQMEPLGDNPIAVVFSKDKASVMALQDRFKRYTLGTELRIRTVYEERIINHQKDEIYAGADVVIATPKRLSKLYFLNGINLMELQMIVVHDAAFLAGTPFHTDINRISQSMKCQHLVFAEKFDDRLQKLEELFMTNAQVVKG
jgi:superfamily II DNA/RNA helicase